MTPADIAGYLLIGAFILLFVGAAVSWGFAAYYMVKTLRRFHPERKWGQFLPVCLFMPWFFTDEGNFYRVKLLKAAGIFMLIVGSVLAFGFFTGMLQSGPNVSSNSTPHTDARSSSVHHQPPSARAGERGRYALHCHCRFSLVRAFLLYGLDGM